MNSKIRFTLVACIALMSGCVAESASESTDSWRECRDAAEVYFCPQNKLCAHGECIDPSNENCGAYGIVCKTNEECTESDNEWKCTCSGSVCTNGTTCCPSGCVNTMDDDKNCGGCGIVCLQNQTCSNGNCVSTTNCGNGKIDAGEICDTDDVNHKTCAEIIGYGSTGTVKCNALCTDYDATDCSASITCGDGKIDTSIGEECDGEGANAIFPAGNTCSKFDSLYDDSGSLKCVGCHIDASECRYRCGNGVRDNGEVCDTDDLDQKTCANVVGFGSEGILKCNSQCSAFDTSECSNSRSCGNGVVETSKGEECDINVNGASAIFNPNRSKCSQINSLFDDTGSLSCDACAISTDDCKYRCGNGVIDPGEACDVGADRQSIADDVIPGSQTCSTLLGFGSTGNVACSLDCSAYETGLCSAPETCGNKQLDAKEECDKSIESGSIFAIGHDTCEKVDGNFGGGSLKCSDNCTYDTRACIPKCGNGQLDAGEACDIGADQIAGTDDDVLKDNESTCAKLIGFGSIGSVRCNSTCTDLVTSCSAPVLCGNGRLEDSEICDDSRFKDGKTSCADYDAKYSADVENNNVSCSDCQIDTTGCVLKCGDGFVQTGEDCDDKVPVTATCEELVGFGSTGTVTCSGCHFVKTACSPAKTCGNSTLDTDEACDNSVKSGNKFANGVTTCAAIDPLQYSGGNLLCTDNCTLDLTSCIERCGDGTADSSEICDKNDFKNVTCKTLHNDRNATGTLTCNSQCSAYTENCYYCGDGVLNNQEECDTNAFKYQNCRAYSQKFAANSGALQCSNSCTIDTSACKPACPANTLQCSGKAIQKCSAATGLWEDNTTCSGQTPYCDDSTGTPRCVCKYDSDCGSDMACNQGVCETKHVTGWDTYTLSFAGVPININTYLSEYDTCCSFENAVCCDTNSSCTTGICSADGMSVSMQGNFAQTGTKSTPNLSDYLTIFGDSSSLKTRPGGHINVSNLRGLGKLTVEFYCYADRKNSQPISPTVYFEMLSGENRVGSLQTKQCSEGESGSWTFTINNDSVTSFVISSGEPWIYSQDDVDDRIAFKTVTWTTQH